MVSSAVHWGCCWGPQQHQSRLYWLSPRVMQQHLLHCTCSYCEVRCTMGRCRRLGPVTAALKPQQCREEPQRWWQRKGAPWWMDLTSNTALLAPPSMQQHLLTHVCTQQWG